MSLNNDEKARLAMEMQAIRDLHDRLEREAELKEARSEAKAEGKVEATEDNVKTMYKNGTDIEMIAKLLSMDINQVKEILDK